ncbi:MAG: 30S ribosomal protein S20 [Rhodospirillaceae bacterium]|jgi:small subunit ribosomal protein S20|nr:30S ribosomal protein S20 [Rhodospirillaceae bacterium]
MANHKSAKKRIRQTEYRTGVNRIRVNHIRTFVKRAESLIESGVKDLAIEALRVAQSKLMHGVRVGVMRKGTVSRKVSRLVARIKSL